MAGIKHLSEILSKKGKDFLNDLFNKKLLVTEKPDASFFAVQHTDNKELQFFKRDDRQPISKLDRTLMRLYEPPIEFLTKQTKSIDMPPNYRFGFEYFQNTNPVSIAYDRLPKNSLVLTHIKKMDNNNNKVIEFIDNIDILRTWAKRFNTEEPFSVFEGKLNKEQKEQLIDFLETPFSDLVEKFKTNSFTRFIISILNPKLKNTALSYGIEKPIEGLMFKFNDGEFLAKLVDPVFTQAAKDKAHERINKVDTDDQYGLFMNSFISWFLDKGDIDNVLIEGNDADEKYIDLMTNLTTRYINDNNTFLTGVKFDKPEFAKAEEFRLNTKMIKNKDVVNFIENNSDFEDIYRIVLSSFRKRRVRTTNLINSDLKNEINKVVNLIKNRISRVNEKFLSFSEWISLQK